MEIAIMPLNTRVWAGAPPAVPPVPQPGPAYAGAVVAAQVSNAIGQLNVVQIFGGPGPTNVVNVFNWRIDRQDAPVGFVNLSVQLNGVGAPSTVASVFVPTALNVAPPGPGAGQGAVDAHNARMSELLRNVRRGLEESLATRAAAPGGAPGMIINRTEVIGAYSA